MKLRSQSYREMVKILKDAGVYVEGMQTSELKQLAQAVEMSTMEQIEANQETQNFETARNEGELEVNSSHPVEVHQSTTDMLPSVLTPRFSLAPMAGDVGVDASQPDCDSPPSEPRLLTVRAVVHHALDWSPSAERQTVRERSADGNSRVLRSHSRLVQTNNKNNTYSSNDHSSPSTL
ncbi:uncharacterized protein [Drosophila pseudoobscura]|uniref:Uncharacterized protein isoform X3 n=1 Tax=Drosophila pseudoobscura pseudoobscura TaxID=46245 RepID=A0A6I8W6S5_DROPS|nr:uncharacterized protein LOC6901192 isoform X3 [Drosophila pseudoobscura]